jgi:hypothetical protein
MSFSSFRIIQKNFHTVYIENCLHQLLIWTMENKFVLQWRIPIWTKVIKNIPLYDITYHVSSILILLQSRFMTDHGHSINLTHLIASDKFGLIHINTAAFCRLLLPLMVRLHFLKTHDCNLCINAYYNSEVKSRTHARTGRQILKAIIQKYCTSNIHILPCLFKNRETFSLHGKCQHLYHIILLPPRARAKEPGHKSSVDKQWNHNRTSMAYNKIFIIATKVTGTINFVTLHTWGPPLWSEFLATDPEVLGSIPGATRFSEK